MAIDRSAFADGILPTLWNHIGATTGSTNQNWWGARLLPMAVSIYPLDCVHRCHLLRTQHHRLCPNGRQKPPWACPPTSTTPHPLPPTHLIIHDTCDITGLKKLSQKPAVNTAWQSYLWNSSTALYLYSKSGMATIQCSTGEPQLIQYFKMVFLKMQNVPLRTVFVNPVTIIHPLRVVRSSFP